MKRIPLLLLPSLLALTAYANDMVPTPLSKDGDTWILGLKMQYWAIDLNPVYQVSLNSTRPPEQGPSSTVGSDGTYYELPGGVETFIQPYTWGWYWGSHDDYWWWNFTPQPFWDYFSTLDPFRLDENTKDDPIQLAFGANSYHRPLFRFHGARDWNFSLTYNSMQAHYQLAGPPMARGWIHNYQASLSGGSGALTLHWNQFSKNTFTLTSTNPDVYISVEDGDKRQDGARYDTITAQTDGSWRLLRRDQSTLRFSAAGQLIEDVDPHGHKLTLTYTGTQLTGIADLVSGTSLSLGYDASGMLQTLTDGASATVQLNYVDSASGPYLSQITNQNGKHTNYTYNGPVNVLSNITDDLGGPISSYGFDRWNDPQIAAQSGRSGPDQSSYYYWVNNQLPTTNYTDHNGKLSVYTFDGQFNLLSEKNPLNQVTNYTYDTSNRMTSVTDPLSRITSYTYDSNGNVLTATDPAGKVTTNTYDSRSNLLTTTDPLSHITTRTYDASNNLLTVTDALGHTTTWTYDSNSLALTMTLPGGGVYHYTYTAGWLTSVTDPNGVVTNFGYDSDGRLLYREDALGKRVTYTYDAFGNVLTVKNGLNQTTTYEYDHRNRVKKVTDPAGAITQYTYDDDNDLKTVTDALGKVTTYTYDGEDRLKTVVDPLNRTTTYNYDDAGRLTSIVDPASNTTSYEYDAAGQLTAVVDALGKRTTSGYNTRGLLTDVTDPLSRTANFTFDDAGRRITSKDPLNRQTGFTFDALNRLQQVTDPGSLVAAQGFDADGNRTSLTNPAANATAFVYDVGGRLTSETTPEGHASGYTYNSRGLPNTVVQPSGRTTSFTYDDAQRLSSTADPVGTISLTRDNDGRVLTVVEAGKTLTRVYDTLGRLTSFTDGDGNVIGYQYDDIGRLKKLTYPGTPLKEVTYDYDTAGRLSAVTDWASRVTSYSYDAAGRMTQTLRPNGAKQTRTYDDAGQLTQLTELASDGITVIYSGKHNYDAGGQLADETLVPAISPGSVTVTQTFDRDNRLLTHNGAAATFDADGNLLSVASGLLPATYTYDARNRLTSAGGIAYTYNAENHRVALTDATGTTRYAVNPNAALDQVLVRTAPDGTKTFYVYGLGLLHEETGSTVRYYHCDRRGDTVALTDGTGAVTDRASYGIYGELLSRTGTTNTPFLFNGKWGVQTDSGGIYYHRARYYHPQLRRFLNQDTVLGATLSPVGLNRFAYANGDPVNLVDPFGLWSSKNIPLVAQPVHQMAIDQSLAFLPEADREILKQQQEVADEDQSAAGSYKHAMRSPNESIRHARAKFNEDVENEIFWARVSECQGNHQQALKRLGNAIHALQDATSPEHRGFQEWDGDGMSIHGLEHGLGESDAPFENHSLYRVTHEAWGYFTGKIPMPSDFVP
jgi:RHS repeat-associated protein